MLHAFLQGWAGLFYLLNKVFFSRAERSVVHERDWRIASWSVYLVGLPAWVTIFVMERNWIAASIETGGAPAMCMGLVAAMRGGHENIPKWLDRLALIAAVIGFIVSLYDFGGITTVNQVLEISIVTGYLIGTYLLAKKRAQGYLWFMLMNASCASLMAVQHYPWLVLQQIVSLGFVVDAYVTQRRRVALPQ